MKGKLQEEEAGDGTDPQTHCELGSQIRSQQAWLAQLRAEEQNLKASIEDLQAKKQKLVQYLKEGAAKLDQLRLQPVKESRGTVATLSKPTSEAGWIDQE